jgi:hypothetical protein
VDAQVQGVGPHGPGHRGELVGDRAGVRRVDELVAVTPVGLRGGRRIAAVAVELGLDPVGGGLPEPGSPDQDAGPGAAGVAIGVDQGPAALGDRQGVEEDAGAEARGAPDRGQPHRRADDRDRRVGARGERGVAGEDAAGFAA